MHCWNLTGRSDWAAVARKQIEDGRWAMQVGQDGRRVVSPNRLRGVI